MPIGHGMSRARPQNGQRKFSRNSVFGVRVDATESVWILTLEALPGFVGQSQAEGFVGQSQADKAFVRQS